MSFIKSFGLPTVVTGGGGYTLRNVARCWAHETAILAGIELDSHIPESDEYRGYYAPNYSLYPPISNMENQNSKEYLNKSLETIVNQIKEKVMPFGPLIDNYKDVALYNTVNERYLPKKS